MVTFVEEIILTWSCPDCNADYIVNWEWGKQQAFTESRDSNHFRTASHD